MPRWADAELRPRTRRSSPRRLVRITAALSALVMGHTAHASDEQSRDHGSRATSKDRDALSGTEYDVGVFGGGYVQGPSFGVLGQVGLGYSHDLGVHTLEVTGGYEHEPFSTKTFNFPEEDQAAGDQRRLAQGMHIIDGSLRWKSKWNKWTRTGLRFTTNGWLPELDRDRRLSLRGRTNIRLGRLSSGAYGELMVEPYYKKFPRYHVADRRLDQWGVVTDAELGYKVKKRAQFSGGVELEWTDYLDARYDERAPTGEIVRSVVSKDYYSYIPFARVEVRPGGGIRMSSRYRVQFHDSRNYSRDMLGLDQLGFSDRKLIHDYYDYVRHRVDVRLRWDFRDRLRVELLAEAWRRDFRTYEARDVDNRWTGQLRRDTSVEAGAEISVLAHQFEALGLEHGLYVAAFGSHLMRRSRMKRELSLATNYDISRVFIGLELRGQ